jgi:hypothetical protein
MTIISDNKGKRVVQGTSQLKIGFREGDHIELIKG